MRGPFRLRNWNCSLIANIARFCKGKRFAETRQSACQVGFDIEGHTGRRSVRMELPEVQHLEDPQNRSDAPVTRPWRMALRNTGAALLGIGALMVGQWLELHFSDFRGAIAWWMW